MGSAMFSLERTRMDILCTCCGETWDVDSVLHEEPKGFTRHGCVITACPHCFGKPSSDQTRLYRKYLDAVAEVARLYRDDIDAFAGFVKDLLYR